VIATPAPISQGEYRWVARVMSQLVFADYLNPAPRANSAPTHWSSSASRPRPGTWRYVMPISEAKMERENDDKNTARRSGWKNINHERCARSETTVLR